jgi:hypothetical protein
VLRTAEGIATPYGPLSRKLTEFTRETRPELLCPPCRPRPRRLQGLSQVLQAAVTGLEPKQPYVLALATQANGGGRIEPLGAFMTNPAGAAIVNVVGPIRQIVQSDVKLERRYLVIVPSVGGKLGAPVQVQANGGPVRARRVS